MKVHVGSTGAPAALLLGACLAALPVSSLACSPKPPPPEEPCRSMRLLVPGDTFPVNLADRIAVARMDRGPYLWSPVSWSEEPPAPPVIYRRAEVGWHEVDYRIEEKERLVSSARQLALGDPVPGHYLVTWPGETCKETPGPIGSDIRIGEFTMTDRAPRPEELGRAKFAGARSDTETVSRGTDAACRKIEATEEVLYLRIDVELFEAMSPWLDTLSTAVVEGERVIRGYAPPEDVRDGTVRISLRHVCAASDRDRIDNRLEEGRRTLRVLGRIADGKSVRSTPVTFGFSCR